MGTLTNSEDQDEMLHNAAFHQGLHVLLIQKKTPSDKDTKCNIIWNYYL